MTNDNLIVDAVKVYREKFGEHSASRLEVIADEVDGWSGKCSKALNHDSLNLSLEFLNLLPLNDKAGVATVFMDEDGHLSFWWELYGTHMLEMLFCPNAINVYTDSDQNDVTFDGISDELITYVKRYL